MVPSPSLTPNGAPDRTTHFRWNRYRAHSITVPPPTALDDSRDGIQVDDPLPRNGQQW
jgi:hypothetical protein